MGVGAWASVRLALFFTGCGRPSRPLGPRLLRAFLADQTGEPEEAWQIAHDPFGAPLLLRQGRPAPSRISLSYTDGLVAVALSPSAPFGIDAERVMPHGADAALADCFFATPERAHLAALPVEARADAFFRIWTMKEALIKAQGLGFRLPLDRFAVITPDGHPCVVENGATHHSWLVCPLPAGSDHRVGLALPASAAEVSLFRATETGHSFRFDADRHFHIPGPVPA